MIDIQEVTYAAIITIELPTESEPAVVSVRLAPNDKITVAEGQVKALSDCTLADLQTYATAIEKAIAADYSSIRLVDLASEGDIRMKITLLDEREEPLPKDWRQHALVLLPALADDAKSARRTAAKSGTASKDASVVVDGSHVESPLEDWLSSDVDVDVEGNVSPVAVSALTPAPAVEDPAGGKSDSQPQFPHGDAMAQVSVAATESAITEREAEVDAPPQVRPTVRVAGIRRAVGDPTWMAVDILIDENAFRDAQAHALSSMDREVAGVLVGPPPEKQPDGRYIVEVTDTIIAKYTRMHGASVTYTPETWRYLNDALALRYPDESAVMVGWYHTHPGFGIFLSGMDQFIHQNFFTQVWHVAMVLDPVARNSGFFCWNRHQSEVKRYEFMWPSWAPASW